MPYNKPAPITAVHHCTEDGGVYVEMEGAWYEVCAGWAHAFAEIKNWRMEHWEKHRKDPPCKPTGFRVPP